MRKNTYKPTSKKRKSTEILLKVTKKQNVSRETKKYRGNTKHFLNEKEEKVSCETKCANNTLECFT